MFVRNRTRWLCALVCVAGFAAPLVGAGPASAATVGCTTYLEYVWQADKAATQYGGAGHSITTSANATDGNNACVSRLTYVVDAYSTQYQWNPYTGNWFVCANNGLRGESGQIDTPTFCTDGGGYFGTDIGNRNNTTHVAWFAGNPWTSYYSVDG